MDWKVFIFTFIVYQLGYWICYLTQVKKSKISFKRKRWKNTIMNMKYTQKTRNGLINNHEYVTKIFPPKHGTYGEGKGAQPWGWWYSPADGGKGVHTYGNKPAEAMLAARNEMIEKVTQVAKEVWS